MKKIFISLLIIMIVPLSLSAELRWVGDMPTTSDLSDNMFLSNAVSVDEAVNVTATYVHGQVVLCFEDYANGAVEPSNGTVEVWNEVQKVAELVDATFGDQYHEVIYSLSTTLEPGTYTAKVPAGAVKGNKTSAFGKLTAIPACEVCFEVEGVKDTSSPTLPGLRWVGDIDNDGKISLKDLTEMVKTLKDKTTVKRIRFYDMNGDNKLDEKDIAELRDILLGKKDGRQLWDEETVPIGGKDDTPFD